MIALLVAAASAACPLSGKDLPPSTRLEIAAQGALVAVRGAAGARLALKPELDCSMVGNVLRIVVPDGTRDVTADVPSAIAVSVTVLRGNIEISGINGNVMADVGAGDVQVTRVNGDVTARSAVGTIHLSDITGRIDAAAQNNELRVTRTRGDVRVSNVSGTTLLEAVQASNIMATTVTSEIVCTCSPVGPGTWEMRTHTGAVRVAVGRNVEFVATLDAPPNASRVDMSGVSQQTEGKRKVTVVRGEGGTRMLLSSFSGGVFLQDQDQR